MKTRQLALAALTATAIIYGVTYTIAKDVMNVHIQPYGFILLRVLGATAVFWLISLFIKDAKPIEKKDFGTLILASFFGVGLNMLTFFKGLSMTTPINASVIMVTTPILVLVFSSLIIKERIPKFRILGVLIGLVGAVLLIVYGNSSAKATGNKILGDVLVFVNAASYGMYLVLVKGIVSKYNPIVFVKWLYTFGLLFVLPFGYTELVEVQWNAMPMDIVLKTGFVVLFTSCVNYLFNLFALSKLKPTTVSVFIYLQPVIAGMYALYMGSDSLNMIKIVATLFIFLGVFIVTRQPRVAHK